MASAPRTDSPERRLDGLQLGRAIAALSVVATHAIAHPFPGAPGLSHLLGRYGVTLFFVISGYIMVRTTGSGPFDRRAFLWRRIVRIVPIYYLVNLVMLAGRTAAPAMFKDAVWEPVSFVQSLLFIPAFQANGSGLIFPFFRLGWTLNYEMFFYLCFALLAGLSMKARNLALTGAFAALFVVGLCVPLESAVALFYTQVDLLGFVAGVWLAAWTTERTDRIAPALAMGALATSLVLIAVIAGFYATIRLWPITQIALIIACAIHIALLVTWIDRGARTVPRPLVLLGDASYSIYLFHLFGVGLVTAFSRHLPWPMVYVFMPVAGLAGIFVGLALYWAVERPVMAAARRWRFSGLPDAART